MKASALALWCALALPIVALAADSAKTDPWQPLRFMIGKWEGTTEGEPGKGTVARSYEFVLGDRFIHERNTSTYPPQKNAAGEVHQHWSFLSYDKLRKTLVLRQFHTEGFVNQYRAAAAPSADGKLLVFESEAFENLDGQWRAREIYDLLGPDEFTETFQLAEPGKDFQTYSKNRFKRVAR